VPGAGACPGGLRAGRGQDPNPLAGGVSVHDSGDINLISLIGICVPLSEDRMRFEFCHICPQEYVLPSLIRRRYYQPTGGRDLEKELMTGF